MSWNVKSVCTVLVGAMLFVGCDQMGSAKMTQSQQLGYTIGVQLGKQFKQHDVTLDSASLAKGYADAYAGGKLALTEKQMLATMTSFRAQAAAKAKQQQEAASKKNLKAGNDFLKANATKAGIKVTKTGLQYKVVHAGVGPKPLATDTVTVDYEGKLLDGTVFDSSYKRGKPATFPVSGLISGWTEALTKMPVGSTWMLYIPAKLAYGPTGAPMGGIGPNEVLQFKLHLISIAKKDKPSKKKSKK